MVLGFAAGRDRGPYNRRQQRFARLKPAKRAAAAKPREGRKPASVDQPLQNGGIGAINADEQHAWAREAVNQPQRRRGSGRDRQRNERGRPNVHVGFISLSARTKATTTIHQFVFARL